MERRVIADRLIQSRQGMRSPGSSARPSRKGEAEGGCGVIGMACTERIPGRHLLQSLIQMRNRGNGKGGGTALAGIDPTSLGIPADVLRQDYLLAVAYLQPSARAEVEAHHIHPHFEIDALREFRKTAVKDLEVAPPDVVAYWVRCKPGAIEAFSAAKDLGALPQMMVEDEFVYQNTYRLNRSMYASLGDKQAFVLCHGKDLLVLKMVGYGDDVIRVYQLEDMRAHVWIGHHRYPTKGRVWHPGGAHPFIGLHETLVHNGDFANYASVCSYLAQRNIRPLFLTDTEVAVLVFDLHHRTYGYPLEYVIESLAPTTERDFAMLPADKREVYRMLQTVHMHGSPDGPWFFLIAQSEAHGSNPRTARLIGVTDTSMLRPQVFALQQGAPGEPSIGFAASEKQAIDAALESLASEDTRFWTRPDRVWNARGGSYTDGGAFIFEVKYGEKGDAVLECRDKFGREIKVTERGLPYRNLEASPRTLKPGEIPGATAREMLERVRADIPRWTFDDGLAFLDSLTATPASDASRRCSLETLTLLIDRRYPTGSLRRSSWLALCDKALSLLFQRIADDPSPGFAFHSVGTPAPGSKDDSGAVIVDARGFAAEGPDSLALAIKHLLNRGYRHVIVAHARGQRFIANGLGPRSEGVRIEVYGSSGDYLGSGIDGAEVIVHGNGQDQLAQIMKSGRLVVHGDVGQTFMYAAKGGEAYVLGNAAGRPMINAVGKPRVVINGTCLDYLAESFMAGDPLHGGGYVILNGVAFSADGALVELDTPYPGGNLFSLASGGAIFVRDPHRKLGSDQLNGGEFGPFTGEHWDLIRRQLEVNEQLFGIPVAWLLEIEGKKASPDEVYRAIIPSGHKALQPEEAWVAHGG